jgi:hypothetical protein
MERRAAFDFPNSLKIRPPSFANVTHSHFNRKPICKKHVTIYPKGFNKQVSNRELWESLKSLTDIDVWHPEENGDHHFTLDERQRDALLEYLVSPMSPPW